MIFSRFLYTNTATRPISMTSSPVLCISVVKRRAVMPECPATKPTMRSCICSKYRSVCGTPKSTEAVEILPDLTGRGAHHVSQFAGGNFFFAVCRQIGQITIVLWQPFDDWQRYFVLNRHKTLPRIRPAVIAARQISIYAIL